jgi:RNA polymerase sigma-70 factor (ECF subfamily)
VPDSPPNPNDPALEPSPLCDPAHWAALIEEVRPDAFLVVIGSSMSKALREQCTPEDIWQETLAQAWAGREGHRWQGSTAFRAWLFEIARNRILDAVRRMGAQKRGAGRKGKRISEGSSPSSSSASGLNPPDSATPSRILIHAERAAAMQRALAALPPELEPVVRLHLLEELTMEQVAERLGIGVSAAWRRFRKGIELYSKQLAGWESGGSSASR